MTSDGWGEMYEDDFTEACAENFEVKQDSKLVTKIRDP